MGLGGEKTLPSRTRRQRGALGEHLRPFNPFLSEASLPRRDEKAEGRQLIAQGGQKEKEGSRWTISSSVEGPRLITLRTPRVQNGAGSQRTFTQLIRALGLAPHGCRLGWADNSKERMLMERGRGGGCQQLRGALKSKGTTGMQGAEQMPWFSGPGQ